MIFHHQVSSTHLTSLNLLFYSNPYTRKHNTPWMIKTLGDNGTVSSTENASLGRDCSSAPTNRSTNSLSVCRRHYLTSFYSLNSTPRLRLCRFLISLLSVCTVGAFFSGSNGVQLVWWDEAIVRRAGCVIGQAWTTQVAALRFDRRARSMVSGVKYHLSASAPLMSLFRCLYTCMQLSSKSLSCAPRSTLCDGHGMAFIRPGYDQKQQ